MQWLIGTQLWERLAGWANQVMGVHPDTLAGILNTALVLVLYPALRKLIKHFVVRRIDEPTRRYTVSRTIDYSLGILSCLLIAKIWLLGRVNLGTYLGIVSAGLAIALHDPISNMAGWVFILWRHPFKVGDRVQVGEHVGDVVDIRMFMFTMLEVGNWVHADQSTGRIIHLPNGMLFRLPCANYTQGFEFIWNEIPVTVTFESDWQHAKRVLERIIQEEAAKTEVSVAEQVSEVADRYKISFRHFTPIVWLDVVDIGVRLTIRYLCQVRTRRGSADRIWQQILNAFGQEPTIDFAYPTQRFFDNKAEGKAGTGGPHVALKGNVRPISGQ